MAAVSQAVTASQFKSMRADLLKEEKRATRLLETISAQRRALPRVVVPDPERFGFTALDGTTVTLPDAFENRRQLILYHMMPTLSEDGTLSCPGCSLTMDHIPTGDRLRHLHSRDTTFIAAAPVHRESISKLVQRLGWTFPFYSSLGLFDQADRGDEEVSWRPVDGAFALEVFFKDEDGTIYHTYETYNRGVEPLLGTYALLDMTVLGRQDDGNGFRLHDEYS